MANMQSVLVLEDDPSNLRIFSAILSSKGYNVVEASTSEEALDIAQHQREPINLLVSDVGLGGPLSGTEVAVALVQKNGNLPVLFVTGTPLARWSESDCRNIKQLPPASVGILEKPFVPAAFESAVERLIASKTTPS